MDDKVYGHFMRTLTGELLSIYNFTLLQWTMSRQGKKNNEAKTGGHIQFLLLFLVFSAATIIPVCGYGAVNS